MDLKTIKCSKNFKDITPLNKGWSKDKKYIITNNDNSKYLLRISDISLYDKKKEQFELLRKVESLNINASKPIEFGILNESKIYMVLTYLEGVDAEQAVSKLDDKQAYDLGIQAGITLRKLHQIPINEVSQSWYDRFKEKMEVKIEKLRNCSYKLEKSEMLIKYALDNMYLLKDRKRTFTHGDYHLGNMIVNKNGIGVIDFDKNGATDPLDDFKPFCWNIMVSEYFQTGLVNGYYNNNVPMEFFKLLALYAVEHLISHLPWACTFGEKEIQTAYKVYKVVMDTYDDFNLIIPKWYKGVL